MCNTQSSISTCKKCPKPFNKDCPVILQIGSGWHKNLQGLIESAQGIKCHLDIIGQPEEADITRMNDYRISYTISHHIPAEEVVQKYEKCDILYFVSRSEGFGMPIIEAQTVGRVVLTNKTEPTKVLPAELLCYLAQKTIKLYTRESYK